MTLTVGGFAPSRSGTLMGKGGNRGRRDNGVSPPFAAPAAEQVLTEELGADDGWTVSEALADAVAAPTRRPRTAVRRGRGAGAGAGTRSGVWRRASRAAPAALEWQDARLPLLGRLWATAWLPSILLAACLVALVYLLQTSGVATTGYDIQRLQAERDDWQLRNEQLQLELAKRRSLTWIESEATGRLGMVRAEPTALAYVKVDR